MLINDDAAVYELRKQHRREPQPERAFPVVTLTGWTVVGAAAGVALLLLLGVREPARVTVPAERRRRGMRLSPALAAPLTVVFLLSLADRLMTLS